MGYRAEGVRKQGYGLAVAAREEPHKRAAFGKRFICSPSRLVRGGGRKFAVGLGRVCSGFVAVESKSGIKVRKVGEMSETWPRRNRACSRILTIPSSSGLRGQGHRLSV
jgi:hypothetical protein